MNHKDKGAEEGRRRQLRGYVTAVEMKSYETAAHNSAYQVMACPGVLAPCMCAAWRKEIWLPALLKLSVS